MNNFSKKNSLLDILVAIIAVIVVGGAIGGVVYGYVENIIVLYHTTLAFTAPCILRVVGIFVPPLGVVMGYIS